MGFLASLKEFNPERFHLLVSMAEGYGTGYLVVGMHVNTRVELNLSFALCSMYRKILLLVYSSAWVTVQLVGSVFVYVCLTLIQKQCIKILVQRVFFGLNNILSEWLVFQISYPSPCFSFRSCMGKLMWLISWGGQKELRSTRWLQLLLFCFVKS